MASENRGGGGCALIMVGLFALALLLWAINIALWILGVAAPLAGIALGVWFFVRAGKWRSRVRSLQEADRELDALVRDAFSDVSDMVGRWDAVVATKGIGTDLEGRDSEIRRVQNQLWAARQGLEIARAPQHRVEAVIEADKARAEAERYL